MSLDCSKQYLAKCDNLCEAHLIGGLYIFNERKRQTYIPQPYEPKDSDHQ